MTSTVKLGEKRKTKEAEDVAPVQEDLNTPAAFTRKHCGLLIAVFIGISMSKEEDSARNLARRRILFPGNQKLDVNISEFLDNEQGRE